MTTIARLETWTVDLPLTHPVHLGALRFTSRDYAIVRVTDSDGAQGFAYGMARNAPVAAMLRRLAPGLLGRDADQTERIWADLYAVTIPSGQRGIALRAISLVDIALWDLRGRRAGMPVHALLGSYTDRVVASVGGGYYRDRRTVDDIASELRAYVEAGFPIIKIPAGGLSAADELRWVRAAREAVGQDVALAIDTHWTWTDVGTARSVLAGMDDLGLAWVEDPLWPEAMLAAAELRNHIRSPIAIGDELSGRWAYQQMLSPRAADIWRVDVTTVGGFTELRRILALASTWGVPVSPHIYPELHVHVAAIDAGVLAVEYVAPDAEIDLSHRFLRAPLVPERGAFTVPTEPGLGIELDFELIERQAVDRP